MSDPISPNRNLTDKFRYLDEQIGEVIEDLREVVRTANGPPGDAVIDRLARIEDHIISVIFNTQSTGNPPVGVGRNADLIRGLITTSNTLLTAIRDNADTTDTQLAVIVTRLNTIISLLQADAADDDDDEPCSAPVLASTGDRVVATLGFDGGVSVDFGREATFAGASVPTWLTLSAEGIGAPLNRVAVSGTPGADARFMVISDAEYAILTDHAVSPIADVRDIATNVYYAARQGARYSFVVPSGSIRTRRRKRPTSGRRKDNETLQVIFCGAGTLGNISVGSNGTSAQYPFGAGSGSRLALFPESSLTRGFVNAYGSTELPGFIVPAGYETLTVQNNGTSQLNWARFRNGAELAGGNIPASGASPNFGAAAGDLVLVWRQQTATATYFDSARVVVVGTNP